jgi:uncharacterized repeat protein (TIGR04138 family)
MRPARRDFISVVEIPLLPSRRLCYILTMATGEQSVPEEKSLRVAAEELALFPVDAFQFVEEGLAFTVTQTDRARELAGKKAELPEDHHISGQELCEGLRRYALLKWGLLAGTVLRRWNITCTMDFGRIVYSLIDAGRMSRTDRDSIEHFREVYDFKTAFESEYRIDVEQNSPRK